MNVGQIFQIINIIFGVCVAVCGCIYFVDGDWKWVIRQLMLIFLGILIVLAELMFPAPLPKYFPLFTKWAGEGLLFLFTGALVVFLNLGRWVYCWADYGHGRRSWCSGCDKACGCFRWDFVLITGWVGIALGFLYIIFQFVKCVEKPGPMKGGGGGGSECGKGCCNLNGFNAPPIVWNICCIVAGVFVILSGISGSWGCFTPFIIRIFEILFGVLIILHEVTWPPICAEYVGWLDDWLGEGCFLIWLSTMCWSLGWEFVGPVILALGILFVVFHFTGCIQKPGPLQGGGGGGGGSPGGYYSKY